MKRMMKHIAKSKWRLLMIPVIFFALVWLSAKWHYRFDLTSEKRYTLSDGTKQILAQIDSNIQVDICLAGEYPVAFQNLANRTTEMLDEFNEHANQKIQYQLVATEDTFNHSGFTYLDLLNDMGISPITDQQQGKSGQTTKYIYPVALIRINQTIFPVNLFSSGKSVINSRDLSTDFGKNLNEAEALLENKLIEGIDKAIKYGKPKPVIGYTIGHGEPEIDDIRLASLREEVILPNYEMAPIDLDRVSTISPNIKTLLMMKPTKPFSENENLKIDQYIMNGGKVVFFLEPLQAEMDSFRLKHRVIPYDQQLQITDLIYHYGARVNPKLLLDLQCDQYPLQTETDGKSLIFLPWNCCPILSGNHQHTISKNVDLVNAKFANTIDTIETKDVKASVLLMGSAHSRTMSQGDIVLGNENETNIADSRFHFAELPVAVLLEGKFTSYFANSVTTAQRDYLAQSGTGFKSTVIESGKILVIADADIVMNEVGAEGQPLSMGINKYTIGTDHELVFSNKKFITNALEYLIDDNHNALMESRNKSFVLRLLDSNKVASEKTKWQLLNILLPVGLILIFALFFTQLRKRRFTS